MTVKIGDRAVYRPRVPYGRQSELFCFVTRVVDAEKGIVDLVAFPAGGEFQHINNVSPKGEVIQIHCWEPYEHNISLSDDSVLDMLSAMETRLAALESNRQTPEQFAAEFERLKDWAEGAPEAKRGPGRPRKADAA